MIQKIHPSNLVRSSVIALMLAGVAGCTQAPKTKFVVDDKPQFNEAASKCSSEICKTNFLANQKIDLNKRADRYDSIGRPVKELVYNNIGSIEGQTLYKYNSDNSYTAFTQYDDGIGWFRSYDSKGNIHQAVVYNANNDIELQYVYAYAPDGTQSEIIYDGQGKVVQSYRETEAI